MSPHRLPAAKRRELEIVAAIAREAVSHHHIESAIRLIELGAERVSAIRMLSIYVRIHGLRGGPAEHLVYSVLATLGNRLAGAELTALLGEEALSEIEGDSLLSVVRNRLRGRVHLDLRRWVELATGETQMGLLEIHVQHAQRFVNELNDTHSVLQACGLYEDLAGVPDALRSALSLTLLDRIAATQLPRREPAVMRNNVPLHPRRASRTRQAI